MGGTFENCDTSWSQLPIEFCIFTFSSTLLYVSDRLNETSKQLEIEMEKIIIAP